MTVGTYSPSGMIVTVTVGSLGAITAGTYDITAYGAQGGGGAGTTGGEGAMISGTVVLTTGEVLKIAVGEAGTSGSYGGGGGGGSFVVEYSGSTITPLIIAGGGGGGSNQSGTGNGLPGGIGTDGSAGVGVDGGGGGSGGGGGGAGAADDASSGGAGLFGNGGNGFQSAKGIDFSGGLDGGSGGIIDGGGFGGGGGSGYGASGGGGGGGYSGGGGSFLAASSLGAGGGGGSFASGTNQVLTAGVQFGNGLVTFVLIPSGPTVTSVTTSGPHITSGAGDLGAGATVTFTVTMSAAVFVYTASPTLTLNDGGTATSTGGSGTDTLTFQYTVLPGQNTADLQVTAFNLNGGNIQDSDGNDADTSGAVTNPSGTLQIDTTPPAAPVITSAALTDVLAPTITGTTEADDTVTVTVAGATYTTTADGSGTWSVNLASALVTSGALALNENGANSVSVTAKDGAGNVSAPGTQTLTIDTTPPPPPVITSAALTDVASPVIAGTAEAGSTVTVTVAGATYMVTADGSGAWSVNLASAVVTSGTLTLNDNGANSVSATATDPAGNVSAPGTQTLTIDTTPPPPPVVTSAALTDLPAPIITGTAEAGDTVTLTIGGATYHTVATGGAWSVNLASAVPAEGVLELNDNGGNSVSVTATDPAGNVSSPGTQTLTIDTTPPLAPVITSAALTDVPTPIITGTAEANASMTVTVAGATYTTTANGSGAWSVNLASAVPTSGPLALNDNGANNVSATATDAAGNLSAPGTQTLTIDTTPPPPPMITSAALTDVAAPVITGTAEAGDTVTVTVAGATYMVAANGSGVWSVNLVSAVRTSGTLTLNDNGANSVSATATDPAGNVSAPGTQTLIIDTTPPTSPIITSAALTNVAAPIITGTAEAGDTITVTVAGATYTTVATGGAWSVNLATAEPASGVLALDTGGANNVSVSATDPAGNPSVSPATQTLTIAAPSINGTVANQGVPNETTSQPFAAVTIDDTGSNPLTVTLSAPGNGTLSGFSVGSYDASAGVYSVTGTADALTAALRALVFTPIAQPNVDVTTTGFTIALGGGPSDSVTTVTAVQQILGLAQVPLNQIVIVVSPDGSSFAAAQPEMTNEAVVSNPVGGQTYSVPAGYQALFLGGSAGATLSDAAVGNAYLVANSGSDNLIANAANDVLVAGSGSDSLVGGSFANTVVGGSGSATVFGGSGVQHVIQGSGSLIFGANNNAGSSVFGGSGGDLAANLTGQNQTVSVGGSAATISVSGSGGNVIGGTSSLNVTISGSANTIQAGSGSNTVFSGGSGNIILGGSVTGSGSSQIFETGSNDTIHGGVNAMAVTTTGATQVFGGSGSLAFVGGSGVSSVFGGTGATTISAGTGGVVVELSSSVTAAASSGTGAITVFGASGGTINLTGNSGKDYLVAGSGSETLNASASSSADWLSVASSVTGGSAMLVAGSGNDTLIAGGALGSTTMTGGSGTDAFVFFKQAVGGANDAITNFAANDSVYIEGYGAGSAGALLSAATVGAGGLTLTLSDSTTITFANLTDRTVLDGKIQYG